MRVLAESYRVCDDAHAAGGVPVRAGPGAAGHAVGCADRGLGRSAPRRRAAGAVDGVAGARPRARGPPAVACRRGPLPRRGRGPGRRGRGVSRAGDTGAASRGSRSGRCWCPGRWPTPPGGLVGALLADRPLLLLDEPTEGVDSDTEAAIVGVLPISATGVPSCWSRTAASRCGTATGCSNCPSRPTATIRLHPPAGTAPAPGPRPRRHQPPDRRGRAHLHPRRPTAPGGPGSSAPRDRNGACSRPRRCSARSRREAVALTGPSGSGKSTVVAARCAGPASAAGWTGCPTGWTHRSARTAVRSPVASASGSGRPGRCWPTARCSSSTNRPHTSTGRPLVRPHRR